MEQALDMCVRGEFRGEKREQDKLVMNLLKLNVLDYVCAATLAYSTNISAQLDTIQIVNRCGPGTAAELLRTSLCAGFVEIWDVRILAPPRTERREAAAGATSEPLTAGHARRWNEPLQFSASSVSAGVREAALASPTGSPPLWSLRGGGECALSADWTQCVACNGSALERACQFRCDPTDHISFQFGFNAFATPPDLLRPC